MTVSFDASLPLERASTIPGTWYTDPDRIAFERDRIFARRWLVAGRRDQVAEPDTYLTCEIAGEPLLIVRGKDGVLRGFFNVCRHRAAPLFSEESGKCGGKIRCRYHGWTYDLEGCLRGTPEFEGVENFAKSEQGLVPIAVAEFGPFVWVHLDREAGQAAGPEQVFVQFEEWMKTTAAFEGLTWYRRIAYDVRCNWKVYIDNYLDGGYHVNTVHPALAGVIDYRQYRSELYPLCNVQKSPLKPAEGAIGATRTGDAAYWWLYPNFMVNSYSGIVDTNLVLPLGHENCRVIFDFYFQPEATEQFRNDSISVAEKVQEEDVVICEQVQRGLGSRSYSTGRFSVQREATGYHFHRLLAADLT